jgi:tight adherence protein B
MNLFAVSVLVFLASATAVAAVGYLMLDGRRARLAALEETKPARLQRLPRAAAAAPTGPVASFDQWFVKLLRDVGLEWNPTLTALLLTLLAVVCGTAMFVWDERLGPALVTGAVVLPLPLVWLSFQRSRRVTRLQEQLPPALEILARSMRAGQSLDQGIKLVGDHGPDPLAKEFRWCSHQLEMGLALPAVMRSLSRRVPLYDMRLLATTLIVHRQTGGNVVTVLERLAQVVRERLNYRRQLRATLAAGRLSTTMVAIVAPGVFVYFFFFRPDYLRPMLASSLGLSILAVAVVLEIIGLIWTSRLMRPTY